jgi:hypothetical protein
MEPLAIPAVAATLRPFFAAFDSRPTSLGLGEALANGSGPSEELITRVVMGVSVGIGEALADSNGLSEGRATGLLVGVALGPPVGVSVSVSVGLLEELSEEIPEAVAEAESVGNGLLIARSQQLLDKVTYVVIVSL